MAREYSNYGRIYYTSCEQIHSRAILRKSCLEIFTLFYSLNYFLFDNIRIKILLCRWCRKKKQMDMRVTLYDSLRMCNTFATHCTYYRLGLLHSAKTHNMRFLEVNWSDHNDFNDILFMWNNWFAYIPFFLPQTSLMIARCSGERRGSHTLYVQVSVIGIGYRLLPVNLLSCVLAGRNFAIDFIRIFRWASDLKFWTWSRTD